MKRLLIILPIFALLAFSFGVVLSADPVLADHASRSAACEGAGGSWSGGHDGQCEDGQGGVTDIIGTVINVLLFLIGIVAVVMLIVGGFRYVVSAGDSNAVEGAKNTILYAIVGIVVAFLAYAAVNFLMSSLEEGEASVEESDEDDEDDEAFHMLDYPV